MILYVSHGSIRLDIQGAIHLVQKCTALQISQACRFNDTTSLASHCHYLAFGKDNTFLANEWSLCHLLGYKICNDCLALATAKSLNTTCFGECVPCQD